MSRTELQVAVGRVLRKFRKAKKFTIKEAAKRARLHMVYYGDVERAKRNPSLSSLDRILKALQVSWDEFGEAVESALRSRD